MNLAIASSPMAHVLHYFECKRIVPNRTSLCGQYFNVIVFHGGSQKIFQKHHFCHSCQDAKNRLDIMQELSK